MIFEIEFLRPCECEDQTDFCRFVRKLLGKPKQERNIREEKEIRAEDGDMESGINSGRPSGPRSPSAGSSSTLHDSANSCLSLPT